MASSGATGPPADDRNTVLTIVLVVIIVLLLAGLVWVLFAGTLSTVAQILTIVCLVLMIIGSILGIVAINQDPTKDNKIDDDSPSTYASTLASWKSYFTGDSNAPNPHSDKLLLVAPKSGRDDGKNFELKDLGYSDTAPESGNFKRGYYNIDGTGANNYCRYVGVPPKTYLACSKEDQQYYYSLNGLDQGYPQTRGIFKLPSSKQQTFCRGVGKDTKDPTMACISIDNGVIKKDNQYYLMGKVGRASNYV